MSDENKFERVPYPEHPDRCQSNRGSQGQCWNMKQGVSQYCPAHGGNRANDTAAKKDLELYRINSYLQRTKEIETNPSLMSLNREVALMKAIIDEKMNLIRDQNSFLQYHGGLTDLIMKAEKLVTSCHRLNERLGNMLSTQQALQFAAEILEIIADEVKDSDVVEKCQERIIGSLDRIENAAKSGGYATPKSEGG